MILEGTNLTCTVGEDSNPGTQHLKGSAMTPMQSMRRCLSQGKCKILQICRVYLSAQLDSDAVRLGDEENQSSIGSLD